MLERRFRQASEDRIEDLGALVEEAGATLVSTLTDADDAMSWLYFRIGVDAGKENLAMAHQIFPILCELQTIFPVERWWWLNKTDITGSAMRLRLSVRREARAQVTTELQKRFEMIRLDATVLRYEPELCLFGGPAGIRIAHDQFCADSRFLAAWMSGIETITSPIIPEGLSLAIILTMLRACGLDVFELWDVFSRVCLKRDFFPQAHPARNEFERVAQTVINAEREQIFGLYADHRAALLAQYMKDIDYFGSELTRAYFQGQLGCGLREYLAPVVLFHWNRIGLSTFHQFELANAAAHQMENISRKSTKSEDRLGTENGA